MEMLLVRHAEPAWSVDGLSQVDPGLTPRGRKQADLLAERLSPAGADELVVTSARRTQETAEPLAAALGLEPQVAPELTEIRMPDWSGTPTELVEQALRDAYRRPLDEWWDGMPGGETFREFHDRIATGVVDMLSSRGIQPHGGHPSGHLWDGGGDDRRIVVVGHAGSNACALGFLLGLEPTPWEWERFVLHHASIARLRTFPLGGAHIFSLRSSNDVEHIPPELRSR